MSVYGEVTPASSVDYTSLVVRDVSNDQSFAFLLSANNDKPSAGGVSTTSHKPQNLSDAAMELMRMSPSHNLLVLSSKSRPGSPSYNLQDLNQSGHQFVILSNQSKASLAENALLVKITARTLTVCFQYMKSLKHWRRRLKAIVFHALRRWAVSSHYLRTSQHKAHQIEVKEQRKSLDLLVAHHTASTKAKAVERVGNSSDTKLRSASATNKPSFRPTHTNPTLQTQTTKLHTTSKRAVTPTMNREKKSSRNSPTRLKSQQYLDGKYFHSDLVSVGSGKTKSRSTTPNTLITAKVSSLASHPFYQHTQARQEGSTAHASNVPAEPGFDHKPLASVGLTARADAAIQALTTRVFVNSPERLAHPHSFNSANFSPVAGSLSSPEQPRTFLRSPLQAFQESRQTSPTPSLSLSQRTTPTRPHLNGAIGAVSAHSVTSPSYFQHSLSNSTSLMRSPDRDHSAMMSYGSPTAAEMAYARSRGSSASVIGLFEMQKQVNEEEPEREKEQISPNERNALLSGQRSAATFNFASDAARSVQEEKKSIVVPAAPRRRGSGSKLQTALSQHRAHIQNNRPSRTSTSSSTPVNHPSLRASHLLRVKDDDVTIAAEEIEMVSEEVTSLDELTGLKAEELKDRRELTRENRMTEAEATSEHTLEDVMVFSSDEQAESALLSRSSERSPVMKPSKHFIYLAFKKLQRKVLQLQELKTNELHAALPAMDFHYSHQIRGAFRTMRAKVIKAEGSSDWSTHRAGANGTPFLFLCFKKLQRKIVQLQFLKTSELRVVLPAMDFHYHRRLRQTFDTLRVKYLEAKISHYRSYDSAINIDNYALTKAFWRLRRHVTHRHQAWFLEQRGEKYHRFLRLSQGFSALTQVAAFGDVPFSGDEGTLQDDATFEEGTNTQEAVSLVQSLRAHDDTYDYYSSGSDGELELNVASSHQPNELQSRSYDEDEDVRSHVDQEALDEVQDLSLWEDRHFDELSVSPGNSNNSSSSSSSSSDGESVSQTSLELEVPQEMYDIGSDDDEDARSESSTEQESFAIGAIEALGLRSAENSPSPRSPLPLTPTATATATATSASISTASDPEVSRKENVTAFTAPPSAVFSSLARSSPPQGVLPQPPMSDPYQAEIMHSISRSRSDEFPGVSGLDMWDWQDLHSVSREFISDSEGDSSLARSASVEEHMRGRSVTPTLSRTPSPLLGYEPVAPRAAEKPEVKANWHTVRRVFRPFESISPINNARTSPPLLLSVHRYEQENYEEENNSDRQGGRRLSHLSALSSDSAGSESDISLFLSDDSHNDDDRDDDGHDDGRNGYDVGYESLVRKDGAEDAGSWPPPRQSYGESSSAQSAPPARTAVRNADQKGQDFVLPPLPSSPCPSDELELTDDFPADSAHQLGYISPTDSDSEIVNIQHFDIFGQFSPRRKINPRKCLEAGDAYWRRTRLSQGVYALNQWVVKSQTVLTMNDILFEFQALRKLRRGFRTLRHNAIL